MRRRGKLETTIRSRKYSAERVDGVPIAEEIVKEAADLEKKRVLRYIQAQAWREDAGMRSARALAPDRPSMLSVHIGPSAEQVKYGPFPEDQIDFSTGPVTMTVQVEIEGAAVAAVEPEKLVFPGRVWPELQDGSAPISVFHLAEALEAPQELETIGQTQVGIASTSIQLPLEGDSSRAFFRGLAAIGSG